MDTVPSEKHEADQSEITPAPQEMTSPHTPVSGGMFEWLLLAVVCVLVLFVRWRLLSLPLERDEGEYAYGAQLLSGAGLLYRDLHSMKWPGIYVAYAAIIKLFGETREGIHTGLIVVNFLCAGGLFLFAREFMERRFAAFSTATFLVLTLLPSTQGIIANAEHFALAWGIFGSWLLVRSIRRHALWGVILSGICMGLAATMKQHAISFVLYGGIMSLIFPWSPTADRNFIQKLVTAACFSAGVLLTWGAMCWAIWQQGIWDEFVLWTVIYPRSYTSQVPLEWVPVFFEYTFTPILKSIWAIPLLGLVGLIAQLRSGRRDQTLWLGGFLAAGILATIPGFYFRIHYFLFIMPAISLLAGLGLKALSDPAQSGRFLHRSPAIARLAAVLVLAIPLAGQGRLLFADAPNQVCKWMYNLNPFVESLPVADFLKKNMAKTDRVVIFGSEPQICFEAKRLLAGGFIYMYPMMELHPLVKTMQEQMQAEVLAANPEYAVLVGMHLSWMGREGSDTTLTDWMNNYLRREYVPCGLVLIHSADDTEYLFAENGGRIDLKKYRFAEDSNRIVIYRRKDLQN